MDWLNWAIGIGSVVVLALLLVDATLVEIPWVRRFRGGLVGLMLVLWGVVIGRASGGFATAPDEPVAPPVEPETFDDEPERKTDAEADDLDLETAAADRELDGLDESNASNRADLDDLLREVEGSSEDSEDSSG